jgi:thiamine-monophosphate kinase
MNQSSPPVVAFLSYAGSEREQALEVKAALEQRDIEVLMDSGFEAGQSVLVNIGDAINAGVVVALITTEYLDRKFTEIEVSAVVSSRDGKFVPVVIGGAPRPRTQRGANLWTVLAGRTYFKLQLNAKSFDDLAHEIKRVFRAAPPLTSAVSHHDDYQGLAIALIYDWEDGRLIDEVARQCTAAGMQVVYIIAAGVLPESDHAAAFSHVAILWTEAAKVSPDIAIALDSTIAAKRRVTYLLRPDSPQPPDGARVLRLEPLSDPDGQLREERRAMLWVRDPHLLRARLEDTIRLNEGIPFHLLGDKFCASRESAATAAAVCRMAVAQLPPLNEDRLSAVLAHAAACRFRGDWSQTAELLADERLPARRTGVTYPSATLACMAEQLSLDFELGRLTDESQARFILSQALATGDWPLIIAAHRQLGMIEEERGQYRAARDHHDRACHYAEDLLDTELLAKRISSHEARVCLRADCLRELGAVEWRSGELQLAKTHLHEAQLLLEAINTNPAADYLLNVVAYQLSRVDYSIDHDYESARRTLQASYRSLQKYDNPIRLATVLESLVKLEMDFIRERSDSASLRATLEKIRRIRKIRNHGYMIARTTKTLGDLDFALGNYGGAKDKYEEARDEFNRLGKFPEKADTLRSLSRCEYRLENLSEAVSLLDESLEQLQEPDHHVTRVEIRSEKSRIQHHRSAPDHIITDTEMTEVGEYAVHDWIARGLLREAVNDTNHIVLGAGDDGAVLRTAADDDLVVSTDAVPPSLLISDSPEAARYAARFAVVSAISDVFSMAAEPIGILLDLHVRRTTSASWTHSFLRSAAEEAARYRATIVGGDLRERDQKSLTVTAIGRVRKGHALTRRGSRVGDLLAVTLSSGPDYEFNGLGVRWAQELAPQLSQDEEATIRDLIDADVRFTSLGLPLEAMAAVAEARLATAAMDTSDGILACAQLIGKASEVGIEIFPDAIEELINDDVSRLGRSLGIAPFLFALSAGYDWEVVLTIPKDQTTGIQALLKPQPGHRYPRIAVIGQVRERLPWAAKGVRIQPVQGSPVTLSFFTAEKFVPKPYDSRAREWLEFAKESTRLLPA